MTLLNSSGSGGTSLSPAILHDENNIVDRNSNRNRYILFII
jgi:hypothetical protein